MPEDFRALRQWVCWQEETRDGKLTKVPYSVHGGKADATAPATWTTFDNAIAYTQEHDLAGIGFVFTAEDSFSGIDLDGCVDLETGELETWAADVVRAFDSYTELSPSGTGLHILARGKLPRCGKRGTVEMYDRNRYFTVTGKHLDGTPAGIRERQSILDKFHKQVFGEKEPKISNNGHAGEVLLEDRELIDRASNAENGEKFSRLWAGDRSGYASDSEADLAFCSLVAFWTGGDTGRMDALFRQSGLYRDKWERKDYRERTLDKALEGRTGFYAGPGKTATINLNGHKKINSPKSSDKPATPTHDELRDRFLATHEDFAFGLGEWQRYAHGVWSRAPEARVKGLVSEVVDAAKPQGIKPTASVVNSVTELTKYKAFVDDEVWDADPDILVCGNGTLHIPTGELRSHERAHHATTSVPYDFDPYAKAPAWKFLLAGTVPDAADFLQEFSGYALTTDTRHEIALWLFGPPGSGRSTLLTGLEAMLGPRAGILGLADLERSQFALANVAGRTLMTATEQPSSYLASTNVLNALISGETIQVERKFRDPYEITPRAKLAWAMNELPRVGDANSGIFRRVKVVSFPSMPPEERNPEIKERIKDEGPGILVWALEGLARLRDRGRFDVPDAVEDATARFKENNDVPALFVADRCVIEKDAREKAGELYKEYKFWCEENGHRPQSSTRLSDDWQRLGFERKRIKGSTYYRGVRLGLPGE